MYRYLLVLLTVTVTVSPALSQRASPVTGADVVADVIDHTRFDSLWRASLRFGKLNTHGVQTEVYQSYRDSLANAYPSSYLPESRVAFWVNAYLALLMEAMSMRVGYRSTVWDSLYLKRDTATIAGRRYTLQQLADTIVGTARTVAVRSFLCTGSSTGPPFPAHALYARTVMAEMRAQLRKLVRSERNVLYDPAGNVLQLSHLFDQWIDGMEAEKGSIVDFLLPWVSETVAAQIALAKSTLVVQVADRIETWKRAR